MSRQRNPSATGHRRHSARFTVPLTPRFSRHVGIEPQALPSDLTATEQLVHGILDDEFVTAAEIAGFAGITVHECRRALATLRTLGMADAQRRGQVSAWRRA